VKTLLELQLEIKMKVHEMAGDYLKELEEYPADVKKQFHNETRKGVREGKNFSSRVADTIINFACSPE